MGGEPYTASLLYDFTLLLRRNRNCRNVGMAQVVSEIGDHFNNIAVFSLAIKTMRSVRNLV